MLTENRENPFATALVDLTRPRAAAIVRFPGALPPEFLPADSSLLDVKPLESDANGCNLSRSARRRSSAGRATVS